ncbi:O-methyltransferase-domain-containing protein [Melanogaster broomeanus]|nr:O-methyltransferase-domain-containing protein [Melanogaster broomeanus]
MVNELPNDVLDNFRRSDLYHNSFLIGNDEGLQSALKNSKENGLRDMAVSPAQGKLLKLLAQSIGAKRILEVGTLGGYSTIWLAQALPEDGELVTLEISEQCAKVARENLQTAGVRNVRVVVGNALETIGTLRHEDSFEPFDLVFIDADKENNLHYFRGLNLSPDSLVDNVVRGGKVADLSQSNSQIEGVRKLLEALKEDKEVEATTIATVGEKGYDGFLYAVKL